MGRRLNKAYKRLDQRIKSWQATIKSLPNNVNPAAYKKPGSMKRK